MQLPSAMRPSTRSHERKDAKTKHEQTKAPKAGPGRKPPLLAGQTRWTNGRPAGRCESNTTPPPPILSVPSPPTLRRKCTLWTPASTHLRNRPAPYSVQPCGYSGRHELHRALQPARRRISTWIRMQTDRLTRSMCIHYIPRSDG